MNVGASIRHIRKSKGMSQAELAEKVNIIQSMLCQIERGTKVPSLPLSTELAVALDCTQELPEGTVDGKPVFGYQEGETISTGVLSTLREFPRFWNESGVIRLQGLRKGIFRLHLEN